MPNMPKAMSAHVLMPGLYDPTGLGFEHKGGGVSSELNGVEVGPDGKWRMYPSLVPGQVGIEDLLAGKPTTAQQMEIAQRYAMSRKAEVPTFSTLQDGLDYEQKRHLQLDQGYAPDNPRDALNALFLSLPPPR